MAVNKTCGFLDLTLHTDIQSGKQACTALVSSPGKSSREGENHGCTDIRAGEAVILNRTIKKRFIEITEQVLTASEVGEGLKRWVEGNQEVQSTEAGVSWQASGRSVHLALLDGAGRRRGRR